MTRFDDRIYIVRDDLMIVIPASEQSMQRWLNGVTRSSDTALRTIVCTPGSQITDLRNKETA